VVADTYVHVRIERYTSTRRGQLNYSKYTFSYFSHFQRYFIPYPLPLNPYFRTIFVYNVKHFYDRPKVRLPAVSLYLFLGASNCASKCIPDKMYTRKSQQNSKYETRSARSLHVPYTGESYFNNIQCFIQG